MALTLVPIRGIPRIRPGDDLAAHIVSGLADSSLHLRDGDILVVCQKVVSKCEGRIVRLAGVAPSPLAQRIAADGGGKDPRIVEVVLRETRRIVKMDRGRLIVETGPGWVCANAGVDESNADEPETVILLPVDPDASARQLRAALRRHTGASVAVLISDTFGRPFREGLTDVALGVAGMDALRDLRGETDWNGRVLHHTVSAQADGLAAAAGLLMSKGGGIPAIHVRGYEFTPAEGNGRDLVRRRSEDLFR